MNSKGYTESKILRNPKVTEPVDDIPHLKQELAVILTKVDHDLGRDLLTHVRTHSCFNTLPKDPRTIMKTPREPCVIPKIAGGEYLHFGFKQAVLTILRETPFRFIPSILKIDMNVDGASLDSGGTVSVWPIQIRIANIPFSKPEPVGVWKGPGTKPNDATEFLRPFVNDVLKVLVAECFPYGGKLLPIQLRCIIADSPGRALLLGHYGHLSLVPCSRCFVVGKTIRTGVTVYDGIDSPLRNDIEYSERTDGSHFLDGDSPALGGYQNILV